MGMSVISGTGQQRLGAIITGTAYFLLGIPVSFFLAFKRDMDVRGLWGGPTLATAYNTIWYNFIIFRIDWKELIRGVKEREMEEKRLREEIWKVQDENTDSDYKKATKIDRWKQ